MQGKKVSLTDSNAVLREQLIALLRGGQAHATFEAVVAGFPVDRAGERPANAPHSAWELIEHMRIAQHDILRFSQTADYDSPVWPDGYWPKSPAPLNASEWDNSVRAFQADLSTFEAMLRDPAQDLYQPFPWGDGQTLLREALVLAEHQSYHIGQLVLLRRLLGIWPLS
jgi:uncharacterized damage-inducible protein DinB